MKPIVISHLGRAASAMLRAMREDKTIIVVTENPNQFTINGVTYEPIYEPNSVRCFPSLTGLGVYDRKRPHVDIREEFELVQRKQSKLCRSDRDWVVRKFHSMYKIVENGKTTI